MYTINKLLTEEYIIKNSRFICLIYPISKLEDVNYHLNNVKYIYKNATHYCYAYILENNKKFSDDGEPSGTAGFPMLQVLEKNNLSNVLAIIVRYFGGIKLGAGPLTRAYANCTNNTLNKDNLIELENGFNVDLIFNYSLEKEISYILRNSVINNKDFLDKIKLNVDLNKNILDQINNIKNVEIINVKEKLITKSDLH